MHSHQNISAYINTQVLAALKGERHENIQSNRFKIVLILFETSILPIIVVFAISCISYFKKWNNSFFYYKKEILFFLIVGLTAVLPIMLSIKQGTYYLLPSVPFFSIALGLILASNTIFFNKLRSSNFFKYITLSLLIIVSAYSFSKLNNTNKRDKILLEDLDMILPNLENGSTIGCKTKSKELSMYAYFMRLKSISVDTAYYDEHNYLIIEKTLNKNLRNFDLVKLNTVKYDLYLKVK